MRSSSVIALAVLAASPAFSAPLAARDDTTTDQSGALKLSSGLIKDGVEIVNGVVTGVQGIKNLFK